MAFFAPVGVNAKEAEQEKATVLVNAIKASLVKPATNVQRNTLKKAKKT